ncbi:MAG: YihY/virulence factor BrkB family protein [Burkholderiaceae bacterium]
MDVRPVSQPSPPASWSRPPLAMPAQGAAEVALPDPRWWAMCKAAVQGWVDDRAASMGAALSYYTFFSMAPLLLVVISVAGLVLGRDAAQGHLMDELVGLFGRQAAASIQAMVASASEPAESWWGTLVGLGAMLVGATTVFAELQGALDRIWQAPNRPTGSGLWGLLRARVLSFGLILGLAFLLMVSLVVGAVVTGLGRWWGSVLGSWEWVVQGLNFAFGFLITSTIFAMIYKLMPRAHVQWKDVWVGALVTSALFSVGKFLIGLYLGASGVASAYGAAGSLAVVLIWVYYSAQVFLMGAEFTWVYARARGSRSRRVAG